MSASTPRSPPAAPAAAPPAPPATSPRRECAQILSTPEIQDYMNRIDCCLNAICTIATEGKLNTDQKIRIHNLCRKVGSETSHIAVLYQALGQNTRQAYTALDAVQDKNNLSQKLEDLKCIISEAPKSHPGTSTFADILKKGPLPHIQPNHSSSVAIYPSDRNKSSEDTKSLVQKIISPNDMKLHVTGLRKTRNGGVIISTDTKEDIEKLKQSKQLTTSGLTIDEPHKRKPRVAIIGVPVKMQDSEVFNYLYHQNLADKLQDTTQESFMNSIKLSHKSGMRDAKTCNFIVEVPAMIRNVLIAQRRVFLNWSSCPVKDFTIVTRCYKCQQYGHAAKSCRETVATCGHCGERGHVQSECTKKAEPPKCATCLHFNKPCNHKTGDAECPAKTLAASASILVSFTGGLVAGYSAVLLPQLKEPGSLIPGDKDSASWIASMAALPMALGCLISGWMMEKYGRKTSHIIICAPILLGWILIACSKSLTLMLVGRFLTGLCFGLLGPVGPVYIAETTDPKYRGFFLAGVSLAIALAILVAHTIGTFLTWQWTATIFTAFPILSVLLFTLVPESPTWLISKGRTDEGVKSFGWLRGFSDEANKELKGIVEMQKAADSEPKLSFKEKIVSLKCPEFRKPLLIMILFFITNQFAGVNAVAFYSIEIVGKSVGQGLDHYVSMLIIDTVRAVMSVVACVISKRFGRRPLCFISGVWTALSMVGLSMFLYFTEGKSVEHLAFIPLLCLLSYICAVTIGLVPLPWIMCGEVFPTKSRGLGSGISSASAFAAFFVVVKTAPDMMSGLGEVVTFLVYGTVAGVGTIVMYFILPETKGKSLQEIEDKFRGETRYDTKV